MLNTVTYPPTQPPTGDVTQQQLQYVRQILPALSLSPAAFPLLSLPSWQDANPTHQLTGLLSCIFNIHTNTLLDLRQVFRSTEVSLIASTTLLLKHHREHSLSSQAVLEYRVRLFKFKNQSSD